jgi:hypothetical protein
MEGLAPSLQCLIEIQSAIQNGESTRSGLNRYLAVTSAREEYPAVVRRFLFAWDHGQDWRSIIAENRSPHRRTVLELAAAGLAGQSILAQLEELRTEILAACDLEIRTHLELLPLKMLVPLLLFQFPAFLILLFGPLLRNLIEELNR